MFVQGSEDREVGDHGGLLIRRCDCFRVNPTYWSPLHHDSVTLNGEVALRSIHHFLQFFTPFSRSFYDSNIWLGG